MRLRRFFGGGAADEPQPPQEPNPDEEPSENDDFSKLNDDPNALDLDADWRSRAADVIPGGASTGSKRPDALYGEGTEFGPAHYTRAAGCRVITPNGDTLIDCRMGLGAVTLGYGDDSVVRAIAHAASLGNVAGLSHTLEVQVAEKLCDLIPCAEQVRFLKSGGEAVAAAVRIARASTGRTKVVGSGYFGWLDWCSTTAGVPDGVRSDFTSVPFDDIAALERACSAAGNDLAAVVLEPVVERLPSREWIAAARAVCDRTNAVLIFDEIKTGFRLRVGGYQEYADVEPDVATFGKAMANGFPIAAVVGRAAIMEAASTTWISSTLAGETTALAAVAAVIEWHERAEVCEFLWTSGEEMQKAMARAIAASGVPGVTVEGIPPMWFLRFDTDERESRFLEMALEHGVMFKRGPYNFPSLAHDENVIGQMEAAASSAFVALAEDGGE
jgi:glutamate-1-semialdehyde 2,1-aminomutase